MNLLPPFDLQSRLQHLISLKKNAIELGGGNRPIVRPNLDIQACPTVDIVADFHKPLPLESEKYDLVYSSYAIEHISWRNIKQFIGELYRITAKNGIVIVVTANLLEQCKTVAEKGVDGGSVELIFGSQEFEAHGGVHKAGFSPEYATKLFKEAGFKLVKVHAHNVSKTDMVIEAHKMENDNIFEREYFENGTTGYKAPYWNYAFYFTIVNKIKAMNPESVLDIGCGRGFVVRNLENMGIKATGMDISNHCWHTRATDSFILWDVTKTPWKDERRLFEYYNSSGSSFNSNVNEGNYPILKDKQFDLCFSINLLEHLPDEKLDDVIREMVRVSKRGFHGIHMIGCPYESVPDFDMTHNIIKDKQWWIEKFKSIAPDYPVVIDHPRLIQYDEPAIPKSSAPGAYVKDNEIVPADGLVKFNCGSFTDMFYFGWYNIDIIDLKEYADNYGYHFVQHDFMNPMPVKDSTVDIVFASHLIEHFTREEGEKILSEFYRVMKPSGVIRLSIPDTRLLSKKYLEGGISDYKYINKTVETSDDAVSFYELLLAGHKTIYDKESLVKLLEKVGFKKIEEVSLFESRSKTIMEQTIALHPTISTVIEAQK